ncbi:MAG: hypothetical protein C4560_02105 [Nitrospiraceae bacterium]|nr:MAG: hypothetical protein C4560_02105 [Nitrospiraceae bacterium]
MTHLTSFRNKWFLSLTGLSYYHYQTFLSGGPDTVTAQAVNLINFLKGPKQFIIPIYQRSIHEAQLLTYLKLSSIKTGLIINFHTGFLKHGIKRLVL